MAGVDIGWGKKDNFHIVQTIPAEKLGCKEFRMERIVFEPDDESIGIELRQVVCQLYGISISDD